MYKIIKNKILNSIKEINKSYFLIAICSKILTKGFCFNNPKLIILIFLIMEVVRLTLENEEELKYKRFFYGFILFIVFPLLSIISQNFLFGLFISLYTTKCIKLLKKNKII